MDRYRFDYNTGRRRTRHEFENDIYPEIIFDDNHNDDYIDDNEYPHPQPVAENDIMEYEEPPLDPDMYLDPDEDDNNILNVPGMNNRHGLYPNIYDHSDHKYSKYPVWMKRHLNNQLVLNTGHHTRVHKYVENHSYLDDVYFTDCGFEDEVREAGVIYDTIIPVKQDLFAGRVGNAIRVKQIEFFGFMKITEGSMATARIIVFRDKQPVLQDEGGHPVVQKRNVTDILEKSPIYLAYDIEEGELPDLFKAPTNYSQQSFNFTKSQISDAIHHMYDVYKDIHPTLTKAEIDTVPAKVSIKFTLKDVDQIVRFKDASEKSIVSNNISFMWIGDYTGGVVLGTMFTRVYWENVQE